MANEKGKGLTVDTSFFDDDESLDTSKDEPTEETPLGTTDDNKGTESSSVDSPDELQVNLESLDKKAPEPKKVKVRIKKSLNTSIGGQWYSFHAGKEYPVTQEVKTILKNGGYLEAL